MGGGEADTEGGGAADLRDKRRKEQAHHPTSRHDIPRGDRKPQPNQEKQKAL